MKFEDKIILITYADSLGKNLSELTKILNAYFTDAIGGVHILPFFPSSADRGFAPIGYDEVDEALGTWEDIHKLAERYYLLFDFMINHISAHSKYYKDFLQKKDQSVYRDFFIRYRDFWPEGGPTDEDIARIYKRKPRAPYVDAVFPDGSSEKIWCTFDREQIDLNIRSAVTRKFIRDTLLSLKKHGMSIVRLDAFAYTIKKQGTNCFFVEPEIWQLLDGIRAFLKPIGVTVLPEIHEHYTIQQKLAERGYWVYDFALPMLVLSAVYLHNARPLQHWLRICPRHQFTTLDTHDGIGIVDVKDLLNDADIQKTKEELFAKGANIKKIYNTAEYHNLDVYQINCTYYSALGNQDNAYLLARAIQFFAPGIPQVYYVGLLAGPNDIEHMEQTKQGRDINRHSYTFQEVAENLKRPVVKKLRKLMRFRNQFPAFHGDCEVADTPADQLEIHRVFQGYEAVLRVDFSKPNFAVAYRPAGGEFQTFDLNADINPTE